MPADPGSPTARPGTLRDRVITALARFLTRCFFRSVESEGPPIPNGPVILAASHLNGFVDPVVVVSRVGALPRFLAKSTLWDTAVARPLLNFARVIPVRRAEDTGGAVDNTVTFAAAVDALRDGALLAVFPEGTTHDDPTIRSLRTGVARIALQAVASGVPEVHIVPVGVSYEDKVQVRGRALVSYGPPITVGDAGAVLDETGSPDRERVRELTATLQVGIESLTPKFTSAEDQLALTSAAEISLRSRRESSGAVPMSQTAATSRRLAAGGPERVAALVALVARYRMMLAFVGLDDDDLDDDYRIRTLVRRGIVLGIVVGLLAPLALAGLFANLAPVLAVLVAGLVPKAPVTKGTIRLLVALVVFPLMWTILAFGDSTVGWLGNAARQGTYPLNAVFGPDPWDRVGFVADVSVYIVVPLLGAIALVVGERLGAFIRDLVTWRTLLDRRGQLHLVRERRAAVLEATADVLDGGPA